MTSLINGQLQNYFNSLFLKNLPLFNVNLGKMFVNHNILLLLIQMQSALNFEENCLEMGSNLFISTHFDQSPASLQIFASNWPFQYNPFSQFQQYWISTNQYEYSHLLVNNQPNIQNHYYQSHQGTLQLQDLHDPSQQKQNKIQIPIEISESYEQAQVRQASPPMKPLKRKYTIKKKSRKNNVSYYWGREQNKRYADFLKLNAQIFSLTVNQKKNLRVNVMMSKKVKTRTPQQCHSHHQKMMKKYVTLDSIIEAMKRNQEGCKPSQIHRGHTKKQDQLQNDHSEQESQL